MKREKQNIDLELLMHKHLTSQASEEEAKIVKAATKKALTTFSRRLARKISIRGAIHVIMMDPAMRMNALA